MNRRKQYYDNNKLLSDGIEKLYLEFSRRSLYMCKDVANWMISYIDEHNFEFEDRTYNLRAGTGIGIYKNGSLVSWQGTQPTDLGNVPKYTKKWGEINGRSLLLDALENAGSYTDPKYNISMVLISATPYAPIVDAGGASGDNVGKGFFTELEKYFESVFEDAWDAMKEREAKSIAKSVNKK